MTPPRARRAVAAVVMGLTAGCATAPPGAQPGAPTPSAATDAVRSYSGIGRISWRLPATFDHYFAVPHFSAGPRIKCKNTGQHDCEIVVQSRDLSVPRTERDEKLVAELQPFVGHSIEKRAAVRTDTADPEIAYVRLTAPAGTSGFRFLTFGYAIKGPAVVHFRHRASDESHVRDVLDLIRASRALDTREIWAWRLTDYRIVCDARFPAYTRANAAAFNGSIFAAVDLIAFFADVLSVAPEEVPGRLAAAREKFAKDFDSDPPERRDAFCAGFPAWVGEAARGVAP